MKKCTTVCAYCGKLLDYVNRHWVTLQGERVCKNMTPHKSVAGEAR